MQQGKRFVMLSLWNLGRRNVIVLIDNDIIQLMVLAKRYIETTQTKQNISNNKKTIACRKQMFVLGISNYAEGLR